MTRKDYILLADALRFNSYEKMDSIRQAIHNDYCRAICTALAQDNPRFDRDRFLAAAGVTP